MPSTRYETNYFSGKEFKMSYSTGILLQLISNKKASFTTGIQFSTIWNQGKLHPYIHWTPKQLPYGPKPPEDSLIAKTQNGSAFRFVDIPLIINFKIKNYKIRYSLNAGFLISYFINKISTFKVEYINNRTVNSSRISTSDYFKRIQISPIVGFGLEKELNDSFSIKVEPTARYQSLGYSHVGGNHSCWVLGINFSIFKLQE